MEAEIAPRDVTPPSLQAPSAKERKYDRQLRLWAAAGQLALEQSHVLIVVGGERGSNSSVAGSEALKNLVLPGIGNFSIADSAIVTEADLGVNFFLEAESVGKSRAEEGVRLLQELNPDVSGFAITEPLQDWLPRPESLRPFNLFILCLPVPSEIMQRICKYASDESVPVISVHSTGLYSSFSTQLPREFPIVDTHPDPDTIQDLRLLSPWPELINETKSQTSQLEALSDHDHGHIPYLLLLLHYLEKWKESHDGQYPSSFKEKTEFRKTVAAGARTSSAAGPEENFEEACSAVLRSINPPSIGSGCRDMFALPSCQSESLTATSDNFWIVANAIKQFYSTYNVLPLPGSLPDMKATSTSYIRLQNIYKSKARADVAKLAAIVRETEKRIGQSSPSTPSSSSRRPVPQGEIEAFAKNASHIKILHGASLPQLRFDEIGVKQCPQALEDDATDDLGQPSLYPIFHYLALAQQTLAGAETERGKGQKQRQEHPPAKVAKLDSDANANTTIDAAHPDQRSSPQIQLPDLDNPSLLSTAMQRTLFPTTSARPSTTTDTPTNTSSSSAHPSNNPVRKISGAELHNISSLTGGMVAQEAIKLLTRQYVPVNNVVVYDGVGARMGVLTL